MMVGVVRPLRVRTRTDIASDAPPPRRDADHRDLAAGHWLDPQCMGTRVAVSGSLGAMAGYSGTPLSKKLGIAGAHRVALLEAPLDFERTLDPVPPDVTFGRALAQDTAYDVIVLFLRSRAALEAHFDAARERLTPAGGLWLAWPKKSSGVVTDVTEDVLRDVALARGLVDNKVCAIDETWSGLRCVVRLKDRPAAARPKTTRPRR